MIMLLMMTKTKSKRKAVKIEQLPPREMVQAFKCKIGNPYFPVHPKKEPNRTCHNCGSDADFKVWFQGSGFQRIEKYCKQCLEKWVILDEVPIIGKS